MMGFHDSSGIRAAFNRAAAGRHHTKMTFGDPLHPAPRLVLRYLGAAALLLLSACSEIGYYGHLLRGEVSLLNRRVPIPEVLADPAADAKLKTRLRLVQDARAFSVAHLALPDNGSYTLYADVERPYVVWNVFATPEFSLQGREWCHPFVGCLSYRGYYEEARARAKADELKATGLDVHVGGVAAYSTLGWFDDPVLSTMLAWSDDHLLETLFHELAHQVLYMKGDTAFNESFATFVGEEGLREFRASRGEPPPDAQVASRREQFLTLLIDARTRLETLYAKPMAADAMRAAKREEFEGLRARYAQLRAQWNGYAGYDGWFEGEINNAKLLPVGLYQKWVPAFAALFAQAGRSWPAFYEASKEASKLEAAARERSLEQLR
jgi:predicted aminopeptidase